MIEKANTKLLPEKELPKYRQLSKVKYLIKGTDNQYLQILLDPNQQIICKRGNILYYEDGIDIVSSINNADAKNSGIMSKIVDAGKSVIKGEKVFIHKLQNNSKLPRKIGFSGNYSGKIILLNIDSPNREFFINPESLLCASSKVHIGISNSSESGSTAFSNGEKLTRLEGKGIAFILAEGNSDKLEINSSNSLFAEPDSVVARSVKVGLKIKKINQNGNIYTKSLLSGSGIVILQTNPSRRILKNIIAKVLNTLKQIEKKKNNK